MLPTLELLIALLAVVAAVGIRIARRLIRGVHYVIDRWVPLDDAKKTVPLICVALDRIVVTLGWLIAVLLACQLLRVPSNIVDWSSVSARSR